MHWRRIRVGFCGAARVGVALLLRSVVLGGVVLAPGCQREAPARGVEHWQAARAAREKNDTATALAQAETGALVGALGRAHTNELVLTRAAFVAEGALPQSTAEKTTLALQLGLLLDQAGLSAADRATLLTARARLAIDGRRLVAARNDLDIARREAPAHSLSARVLATLDLEERKDPEALALFEKVVTAGDLSLESARGYATALLRMGQAERAAQFMAGALSMHQDPVLVESMADAAEQLGRPQLALAALEQQLRREAPPALRRRLGEAYLDLGRLDEAERELRSALSAGPDVATSLSLASVELERGHLERARAAVDRLYEQIPATPRALFTATVILAKTGDVAGARTLAAQFGQLAQRDTTQRRRAELLAALFKTSQP
ncbi:MAG: tetratricopeptide repeat protein [Myxococcaceae bacterium]|nr:tetratricopeptide repeat protein [Myxococcaceae bacterium]